MFTSYFDDKQNMLLGAKKGSKRLAPKSFTAV